MRRSFEDTAGHARAHLLGAAVDTLTPRQKYVVAVLGETDSMADAADRLGIHPSALSAKLRSIANRLGLAGTSDLVQMARRRQVLDASAQGMAGIDSNGICVFANRRMSELVGFTREELVGACLHDLYHSKGGMPRDECPINAVTTGKGLTHSGETVIWHKDGTAIWVGYSAVAAGESGDDAVAVVTFRDLTAQVRMEREISSTNARLELALEAAGVTAFEIDLLSEEIVGWGRLIDSESGTTFDEFLSRLRAPDGQDVSAASLRELPLGTTMEHDLIASTPEGGQLDVRARLRLLSDEEGRPSRLLGAAVDTTARRDAERIHQAVLEISSDAFVGMDQSGRVTEWNAAAETLFGYGRDDAIGRLLDELIIPPRYREAHRIAIRRMSASDRLQPVGRGPLELTALDARGREFPIEVSVTSVPLRDGVAFRGFIRDISSRKEAEARLIAHAVSDELTGLANRALLEDRLTQAKAWLQRSGGSLAVLFIDLDRFKLINDSLGHAAGDAVLRQVADRLRASLRPTDTAARFGGDEFVVLCEGAVDHEAAKVAARILASLDEPLSVNGQDIVIGASIGIAVTDDRGASMEDLFRDADAAMYRAKERGRGRIEMFNEAMRHRALGRLQLEAELRRAIASDELRVFYQPIVDTVTEQIYGVEALVRWEHPERGLLAPSEFVPVAEEIGLDVPLGAWVLEAACADVSAWPVSESFRLSVNLSARQLVREDLPETVEGVLARTGLRASQLLLEITETGLMDDTGAVYVNLSRLHGMGVSFALDDFGTGYSSLLRLRRFPIDVIKLDRLFVSGVGRNGDDTAILQAIAGLARVLGVAAVAEGVETSEQFEFIRDIGCGFAQGYRWSPAVPEHTLRELLRHRSLGLDDMHVRVPVIRQPVIGSAPLPFSTPLRRVVLVDDSPGDRSLIQSALGASGVFQVVAEASSAEEAIEVVRQAGPDLVVLDMSLPGQDGLTALSVLHEASPLSRIALVSGLVSDGLRNAALKAGADACLDKGLSPTHLVSELAALFPTMDPVG